MPPADAGSGLIFVENEGLTALATIMSPTFVGSEFRSPLARQLPICRYLSNDVNAAVLLFENSWNLGLQFVKKSV